MTKLWIWIFLPKINDLWWVSYLHWFLLDFEFSRVKLQTCSRSLWKVFRSDPFIQNRSRSRSSLNHLRKRIKLSRWFWILLKILFLDIICDFLTVCLQFFSWNQSGQNQIRTEPLKFNDFFSAGEASSRGFWVHQQLPPQVGQAHPQRQQHPVKSIGRWWSGDKNNFFVTN